MFNYQVYFYNGTSNIWESVHTFVRPIRIKHTLDESLDEMKLFLSFDKRSDAIVPFTKVKIIITDGTDSKTYYYVTGYDDCEQKTFRKQPYLYNHDISLYEPIKLLERVSVDNLSFTNLYTRLYNGGRSLKSVVSEISTFSTAQRMMIEMTYTNINNNVVSIYSGGIPFTNVQEYFDVNGGYNAEYQLNESLVIKPYSGLVTPLPSISNFIVPSTLAKQSATWTAPTLTTAKVTYPNGQFSNITIGTSISLSQIGKYKITYVYTDYCHFKYTDLIGLIVYTDSEAVLRTNTITYEFVVLDININDGLIKLSTVLTRLFSITPTRFNSTSDIPKYQLALSAFTKLQETTSPEFIFTQKNLKEVLFEIGGVINAIPYLEGDFATVNYFFLSNEEADNTNNKKISETNQYDADSYTASYDMYVDNMINPAESLQGKLSESGYAIGRGYRSEDIEISESDICIPTDYPIYKITNIYVMNTSNQMQSILRYVYEFAAYQTLRSVPNSLNDYDSKVAAIYYNQGKANLYGLTYKVSQNKWADASNSISIKNILKAVLGSDYFNLKTNKIRIDYIPFINARVKFFKTDAPYLNMKGTMFNSQTSNIVDSSALGNKMTANINKTGNKAINNGTKVFKISDVPEVGTRTSNMQFVNTVTIECEQAYLLVDVTYVKDYQRISDYINIMSRQRYYEISEKQSIDRFINTDMFYVFGDRVSIRYNVTNGLYNGAFRVGAFTFQHEYIYNMLIDLSPEKINGSIIESYSYDSNNAMQLVSTVYRNTNAVAMGNTICLITDFVDNYSAGNKAVEYQQADETDALVNKAVRYCDENGIIEYVAIENVGDSKVSYSTSADLTSVSMELPDLSNITYDISFSYPVTEATSLKFVKVGSWQNIIIGKDNREVLHFNQQFHFVKNNRDIVIGSAMTQKCRMIQEISFTTKAVFLSNTIDEYENNISASDILYSTDITSSNIDNMYVTYGLNGDSGAIYGIAMGETCPVQCKAWAILTNTNELIVGKNIDLKVGDEVLPIAWSLTSRYN